MCCLFVTVPATPEIYTLSLHDALPIYLAQRYAPGRRAWAIEGTGSYGAGLTRFLAARGERVLEVGRLRRDRRSKRSEEHTSELQSRVDLVCRLLLEKKKKRRRTDQHQT